MSLLTIIQRFTKRTGVVVPTTVTSSLDSQIIQLQALLEEEGEDLSKRGEWEALTVEKVHTTTAAEDQGAITTIATNGFRYICNETMWDRTDRLPVPLINSVAWQNIKATANSTPRYRYRIRGGKLLITPTIAASHSLAFEYQTKNWITDLNGINPKAQFTADTDLVLLHEDLMLLGLRWRWKKEKGLDYEEDFRTYEQAVTQYLSRDGGKPIMRMDGMPKDARPGMIVPEGSWAL